MGTWRASPFLLRGTDTTPAFKSTSRQPEPQEFRLPEAGLEQHGDPLTVFVGVQAFHETGFFVVGQITNAPARLAQHPEPGHGILLGLAIADGHVMKTLLKEGKTPIDRGRE
jgi:hypothetical protein